MAVRALKVRPSPARRICGWALPIDPPPGLRAWMVQTTEVKVPLAKTALTSNTNDWPLGLHGVHRDPDSDVRRLGGEIGRLAQHGDRRCAVGRGNGSPGVG